MTSSPSPLSNTLMQALAASAQGDSDQALSLMQLAMREEPDSALPHFLAGAEYAALGQLDIAEHELANALLLAPGMAIARYQLGLLQYTSGRIAVAGATWLPLLELDGDNPLPHWVRGFMDLSQDRFDTARRYFEAGLARNHENPPMSSDIRKVLQAMDAQLPSTVNALSHPDTTPSSEVEDTESLHVLLSNYRH